MSTKAETKFGNMPIEALEDWRVKQDFFDWREKVAKDSGPREADNRLSAISAMLTWAVERGRLSTNHLKGYKRLYHSDRSEIIWLPEHIDAFMRVAPIELQRALLLALHTGRRQGTYFVCRGLPMTDSEYDFGRANRAKVGSLVLSSRFLAPTLYAECQMEWTVYPL
jgi:hypothetical protein